MSLINAIMVPHPPLIIPEIGKGEEKEIQNTIDAYRKAAAFIRDGNPDTIVIVTPHTVQYEDWFHISPDDYADGDFADYGAPGVSYEADYDEALSEYITINAQRMRFPAGTAGEKDASLDHGCLVPMHFLKEAYGSQPMPMFIRVGLSGRSVMDHYYLGMLIAGTADEMGRNISIIASGDLSHKLTEDGPYGFDPAGPEYDKKIMDVMSRADFGELFGFTRAFRESAAECGHKAFTLMAGAFEGVDVQAEVLSYEGPYGVGYGVCTFAPGAVNEDRCFLQQEIRRLDEELGEVRDNEDEFVKIAKAAVETYVKEQKVFECPRRPENRDIVELRAGVFVSLYLDGELRGCMGTVVPDSNCIGEEIILNAISACTRDDRFDPVTEEELPYLQYTVDVLTDPEVVADYDDLDPKVNGIVVLNEQKHGLLLPDLEGIDTVEKQIAEVKKKAGLAEGEEFMMYSFQTVRHQ